MASVSPGHNELAQLMSDHILCDIDRNMLTSVMNRNSVAYERRENGGTAGPCLNDCLFAGCVQRINLL